MPKTKLDDGADLSDAEDTSPTRNLSDDDVDTVDVETGDSVFDDVDPRFRLTDEDREQLEEDAAPRKKPPKTDEQDEDEEDDEDKDDEDEESEAPVAKDEDEDDEDDEDDIEDDDSSANRKWRKRLKRESRLRREVEEENEQLVARVDRIEQVMNASKSKDALSAKQAEAATKLADIRTKLKAAKDAGDTDAEITLTEEMVEVRANLKAAELQHAAAEEAERTAPPVNRTQRLAQQWMRRHSRYNTDEEFKALARAIDNQLVKEGSDPGSKEHFAQLDKRLAKRFPEEYPNRKPPPKPSRHPAAAARREASRESQPVVRFKKRNGKYQLTERQKANMRRFGMDPTNPNDARDYVTNNL